MHRKYIIIKNIIMQIKTIIVMDITFKNNPFCNVLNLDAQNLAG